MQRLVSVGLYRTLDPVSRNRQSVPRALSQPFLRPRWSFWNQFEIARPWRLLSIGGSE